MMNDKLTLTELQLVIKDSLYMALPGMYWVIAEISDIKENYAGHCYLELVEKQADEKSIRSRVKAVIWSSRYQFLKSFFENTTGESLKEGLKILIKVKIDYHEIYGLSLVISDIDPSFTLGEMALRRQQILKKLEDEGVLSMNKELEFPVVPQRVAIVSSKNAAGYTDFMKHLTENIFGYTFYTALIESPMQGSDTENGIINALNRIAARIDLFDVVVIIRGGGSQTDLSWFDNYNIAYLVTQFPIPVITGIGHEKDLSVTDIVAHKSLKTPTAVADFLIECMNSAENHLADMSSDITRNSQLILEIGKQRIESLRVKLIPVARIMISEINDRLSGTIIEMINIGKDFIIRAGFPPSNQKSRLVMAVKSFISHTRSTLNQEGQKLVSSATTLMSMSRTRINSLSGSLKILDPDNVMKRGYTITTLNDRIIKSSTELSKNDNISTRFSDGSVGSIVVDKQEKQ
jgi:exodeoxyribonuclease VII large subunit